MRVAVGRRPGLSGLCSAAGARSPGRAGTTSCVLDKGRSPGGRLATRRIGAATLDHGAQFFTVRSERFAALVHGVGGRGAGRTSGAAASAAEPDGYPRYAVRGGMNALRQAPGRRARRPVRLAGLRRPARARAGWDGRPRRRDHGRRADGAGRDLPPAPGARRAHDGRGHRCPSALRTRRLRPHAGAAGRARRPVRRPGARRRAVARRGGVVRRRQPGQGDLGRAGDDVPRHRRLVGRALGRRPPRHARRRCSLAAAPWLGWRRGGRGAGQAVALRHAAGRSGPHPCHVARGRRRCRSSWPATPSPARASRARPCPAWPPPMPSSPGAAPVRPRSSSPQVSVDFWPTSHGVLAKGPAVGRRCREVGPRSSDSGTAQAHIPVWLDNLCRAARPHHPRAGPFSSADRVPDRWPFDSPPATWNPVHPGVYRLGGSPRLSVDQCSSPRSWLLGMVRRCLTEVRPSVHGTRAFDARPHRSEPSGTVGLA